jgi:CzcA family heavy metal efflux pump
LRKTTEMRSFFTSYRNPMAVAIILVVLGGAYAYNRMHTTLFPEITFPKIKVIADAGEQPVDQMMLSVTRPLEMAIKKVPDLQMVRSSTSRGSCEISAFMDWDADIDLSQQRIESRINEIRNELPAGLSVSVERMNPSILPVIGYTLESHNRSLVDLKYLANYTVRPFLSQVEGVSEVRVIGGKEKEYRVELDQSAMARYGITPETVQSTMAENDFIRSNGFLSDYRMLYLTVTDAMIRNKQQLENLVVRNDGKNIIRLKDISRITIREAKEYVKINANGKENVLVAVIKQPNANLIELSDLVAAKLQQLRKILPKDVVIKPYYVQADFVEDTVKSVSDALWIGILLAIVVAIVFLRSAKTSLVILITIPVSLLLTIIVLYATGQTLNIMTLGAIAASIGLVIDDAIVVVEQIHRTHEENPGESPQTLVQKAIQYLFPAMVGSSLSTIVIFLPFVLMSGVAGAWFKVMTNAMVITLVCSFFVTWLAMPVIYLAVAGKKGIRITSKGHDVKRQQWVGFFIRRPWISLAYMAFLVIALLWILPRIETGFLPEMDEGSIVLDYKSPAGTSLEETDRMLQEVEKIIIAIPEVETYSRRTGTQMGFFITEPNDGDYLIQLRKNRDRTTEEVIEDIRRRIEATQPALSIDFGQVIGDMLGDLMESVQPVEVKIFGSDNQKLAQLSRQVAGIVEGVPGTADVFDGIIITGPVMNFEPDYVKLAQYGITPADLQFQMQNWLEGNVVGKVNDREQFTDIRMMYGNSNAITARDLEQVQVFLPGGKRIPVSNLVKQVRYSGQPEIQRENLQNMGVVTARLESRDLGSVMKDITRKVSTAVSLPEGYSIIYGGAWASQQKSFNELLTILILASLLVFCVILGLYRDFRIAAMILFLGVLGISGSYLALYITGIPLNVGSYTGMIMIVGIIGENAIFTILQYRESRSNMNVDDSIVYAISTRLRPKLMTALGAVISLMPLALAIGPGAKLHQPLAVAITGGFIVALPLLLVVLPTMLRLVYTPKKDRQ